MTSDHELEIRKRRGDSQAAAMLRRAAVRDHARLGLKEIMGRLEDKDADFVVEVLRALLRAAGSLLAEREGKARAVGVIVGVLTNIAPAWKSEAATRRDAAEALFKGDAA